MWTSGAHHATAFFVLARSEPLDPAHRHAGLSQFIVELDSPGIEIRPIRLLTGQHHFNEVVLDKVFVPDELVLGRPGDGWAQVTSELAVERSGPERILSSFPLLTSFVEQLGQQPDVDDVRLVGGLVARLFTLRQLSLSIAGALSDDSPVDVPAAVVKDLGTRFERELVRARRRAHRRQRRTPKLPTSFARLLAEGVLHAPGFTLRGGTSEILRGVMARGLGLR